MEEQLKTITVRLEYSDFKRLKQLCLDIDTPMTVYIRDLIAKDMEKRAKKASKA
jgi:predicted DNA-binding protein